MLECGLTEELKWRQPCYTYEQHNVCIISSFKDCCLLGFFKGVLLKDRKQLLSAPGPNTQSARQMRFTSLGEIDALESTIKAYVREATALERAGKTVDFKPITEHAVPEELQARLDAQPAFKKAFEALTPGRRREYMLHIAGAKQAKTRTSRVEKCVPRIMAGKGLRES